MKKKNKKKQHAGKGLTKRDKRLASYIVHLLSSDESKSNLLKIKIPFSFPDARTFKLPRF